MKSTGKMYYSRLVKYSFRARICNPYKINLKPNKTSSLNIFQ